MKNLYLLYLKPLKESWFNVHPVNGECPIAALRSVHLHKLDFNAGSSGCHRMHHCTDNWSKMR